MRRSDGDLAAVVQAKKSERIDRAETECVRDIALVAVEPGRALDH
jgi:hypothetical protein